MQVLANWTAQDNLSGQTYSPIQNISTINKLLSYGTLTSNNAVGGANELYSAITEVSPSGTATLNLSSFTDILGNTNGLARVKLIMVQNLSTTDDFTYGTNCNSIKVGGGTFAWNSGQIATVLNGGIFLNGSNSASGVAVVSGQNNLLLTNLDSVNNGSVQVTIIGGTN